jgi:hypothetical protein
VSLQPQQVSQSFRCIDVVIHQQEAARCHRRRLDDRIDLARCPVGRARWRQAGTLKPTWPWRRRFSGVSPTGEPMTAVNSDRPGLELKAPCKGRWNVDAYSYTPPVSVSSEPSENKWPSW